MLKTYQNSQCIFAIMNQMATQYDAINLTRPSEVLKPHDVLIKSITKHISNNNNQYAPAFGIMNLRQCISEEFDSVHGETYDPEKEVTITNGAADALFIAITAFVEEGDEVIIFEPTQEHYASMVKMRGGIPVFIDMKLPDFSFDWDSVQKAISVKTKLIIINTPNNPSGTVLSNEDMVMLQKIVNGTNIRILSDESYKNLIYDFCDKYSLATKPSLKERSIIINSFSKLLNIGGWRLGYVLAPDDLTAQFRRVYQFSACSVNLPGQLAMEEVMREGGVIKELVGEANDRRVKFQKLILESKYKFNPSYSTYFQVLNYSDISNDDDVTYTMSLVKGDRVAAIPVSSFYKMKTDNKFIRVCYAQPYEELQRAADILLAQ